MSLEGARSALIHAQPVSQDQSAGAAPLSVELRCCDQIDDALMAQWRDLAANAARPNPFYQPDMLGPALKAYGDNDKIQLLIVCDRTNHALIGLLPIVRGRTYGKLPIIHYQTWRHVHFYNGSPLVRQGYEDAFLETISTWIDSHPNGARFFRFLPVHVGDDEKFRSLKPDIQREQSFERALLVGGQNFDALLETVYSAKKRKELRRQFRRLADQGALRFEAIGQFDTKTSTDARQILDQFTTLELTGWKGEQGDPVALPQHVAFFEPAMLDTFARGNGLAVCLYQKRGDSDALVAMLICLRDGHEACAYKTTYDESLAAFSPGIHVLIEATRLVLAHSDITIFDSCAKPDHPVADKLWPQRREIADFVIPASDRLTGVMMRSARVGAALYARARTVIQPSKGRGE